MRLAKSDTVLPVGGGSSASDPVFVRKGDAIMYSVWSMHRRKDIWGLDASEFRPERWEKRQVGWEFLPFNGGPRICLGRKSPLALF
jgi:cytochrome P450